VRDTCLRDIQLRLKTVRGHLMAVERMIASQHACSSVLPQVFAIQRALDEVTTTLIEEYTEDCLAMLAAPGGRTEFEQAIRSLRDIYQAAGRVKARRVPTTGDAEIDIGPRRIR